jgi:hypothetical protein
VSWKDDAMNRMGLSPPFNADRHTMQRYFATQAAELVERLPAQCCRLGQPTVVLVGLMYGFMVNVRLLIEFLGITRGRTGDAIAAKLDPAWQPPSDQATVQTLIKHWTLATKHAVHFSNESHIWPSMNRSQLDGISDDVLTVWDQYAVLAAHPMIQRRGQFTIWS